MANAFQIGDGSPPGQDNSAPFDPNVGSTLSSLLAPDPQSEQSTPADVIATFFRDYYSGPIKPSDPLGSRSRRKPDPNDIDQSWRRIDNDWLGVSTDLAMQLDSKTNNTSLALALEFLDTGGVFFFVADARVGNWLSWQDQKWTVDGKEVTGPDLLARAVYYKVGHHGSQNATLSEKGLGMMNNEDLAAFIPTNERDAKKVKWGARLSNSRMMLASPPGVFRKAMRDWLPSGADLNLTAAWM